MTKKKKLFPFKKLLDDSLKLLRVKFKPWLALQSAWLVVLVVTILLFGIYVFVGLELGSAVTLDQLYRSRLLEVLLVGWGAGVVLIVCYLTFHLAQLLLIADKESKKPFGYLKPAFKKVGALFVTQLVRSWVLVSPILIVGLLMLFLRSTGLFWFLLATIIGCWGLGIYLVFAEYSFVFEKKKGALALVDSFSLVRGRFWPVLGRLLFLLMIQLCLSLLVQGIMSDQASLGLLGVLVSLGLSLVVRLFSLTYLFVAYRQFREIAIKKTTFCLGVNKLFYQILAGLGLVALIAANILFFRRVGFGLIDVVNGYLLNPPPLPEEKIELPETELLPDGLV